MALDVESGNLVALVVESGNLVALVVESGNLVALAVVGWSDDPERRLTAAEA